MDNTETVRLTVSEHHGFQPEFPERFDWSLVINGRHKELCEALAEEIVLRRARWTEAGNDGIDPLIPGLQEALRVLARQTIWRVMQVKQVWREPFPAAETDLCITPVRARHSDSNKQQAGVARKLR